MSSGLSEKSTTDAFELSTVLARLGLSQYEERLRENGFSDWETVTAITETDMAELDFKRGDRRKLQHAIHEYSSSSASHGRDGTRRSSLSSRGQATAGESSETTPQSSQQAARTTRRYRRHPRPDPDAPPRPKTAYVLFGEHVRQDPTLGHSSFTEIAKETGKRWRELSPEERVNTWEIPAANRFENHKEELERYKQTRNYRNYQSYLEEFKQQQHNPESTLPSDNEPSSAPKSASPYQPPASFEGPETTYQDRMDTDDQDMGSPSEDTASPANDGMAEVRHISRALGVNSHLTRVAPFPSEDMTAKAVETFLGGTGSLLYLWNRQEAVNLVRSVYHPQGDSKPIHATEVFAMAAVGSYCDAETHSMLVQEKFLHFFLYMMSSSLDMYDLHHMRLCACLAICRFTNNVESARRLMLSALNTGRHALASPSFKAEASQAEVSYWRNVFRSVVFLESWFAYNTTHESRVTKQDLTFFHSSGSHTEHEREAFQEHVGELGRLATYIALDLKTATQPKVAQASTHFECLNQWHRTLPPPMQLSRLSLADPLSLNRGTKRALLQLHVLFLSLFIEPFRDCLVDLAKFRLGEAPIASEIVDKTHHVEEQCVLAARQSARVASLLQTDNLIRSHCWVSIYTSFTACGVLLFSASQKLLQLSGEEASRELLYAASHLNVLSFCSYDNTMARRLYGQLQIIFSDIREVTVSPVYRTMGKKNVDIKHTALVPLSRYDAVEGAEEVSQAILGITRSSMGLLRETLAFIGQ